MNIGCFQIPIYLKNGVATALKLYKDEMEKLGHNVFLFVPKYDINYTREEKM